MIRVALLLIVVFAAIAVGGYLISRLVVYWRNQLWKWKLEKEQYERQQLREAEQDFIDSTKMFDEKFDRTKK